VDDVGRLCESDARGVMLSHVPKDVSSEARELWRTVALAKDGSASGDAETSSAVETKRAPVRVRSAAIFGLLAASAAVVFLAISLDPNVYAPGAGQLHRELHGHAGITGLLRDVQAGLQRDLSVRIALRKVYSVIAFGIVGFFAAPILPNTNRVKGCALLVAFFSAVIEIAQGLTGAEESLASNAFDIACGAVGGLLGALAWNGIAQFARRRASR
jgi:hypothetical protein